MMWPAKPRKAILSSWLARSIAVSCARFLETGSFASACKSRRLWLPLTPTALSTAISNRKTFLVRPDGYVKVVDFGLARHFSPDDATPAYGLTVGTLRYMSPEQLRGKSISPASDIFSLGLVLHELAAGEHPFASDLSMQTAYSIATQPFALPPNRSTARINSSGLERLIAAMLAKDPTERPSAVDVAERIEETLLLSKSVALG